MLDPRSTPERFYHVSQGQLSIARHYGGCTFNGHEYVYDPTSDTLIRADVLRRERHHAEQALKRARMAQKAQQGQFIISEEDPHAD